MALCSRSSQDPLLKEMLSKGINLILPPRDDIECGNLVIAEGQRARRASWKSVLAVEPECEDVARTPFKSFDLKVSEKLSVGVVANLTGAVLASLGFKSTKVEAALKGANCDQIKLKLLAPALRQTANTDAILDQLREAGAEPLASYDEFELYLVRGVWRARGIAMELYDYNNRQMVVSPEIAETISGSLEVKMEADNSGRLTYAADKALIFGIEVGQLIFEGGMIREGAPRIALKFRDGIAPTMIETKDDSIFVELDY